MNTTHTPAPFTQQLYRVQDSCIHGRGVYALRAIPAGTRVMPCRGVRIEAERIADDCRGMQIDHGVYLIADPQDEDPSDFVNHSCEPNVGFTQGDLTFYALRDIAAGRELLWDYSTSMNEPGWSVPCRCGSSKCRGVIRSFCDLPHHHREALRGIALRYLR